MDIRPILSTLMRHKTAAALIVVEIALTCAIICNALFMIGDRLAQVREVSGLAEDELVRVQVAGLDNPEQSARTRADLAALRALPGVKDATVVNQVPFVNSSWNSGVRLSADQRQSTLNATTYMAEDRFVETLGLTLAAGRDFTAEEYREAASLLDGASGLDSIPATIITRSLAERLFPGQDPIGKSFYSWGEEPIRVVGVVEHLVRPSQFGGPAAREYSMVFPLRPHYNLGGNYVIRTMPERRAEVLEAAKAVLRGGGADRIIIDDDSKTMEQLRSEFYQGPRSMAWLLGIVCVTLLLITALGIVGLASFWVQQRTKQIGVRRALGATRGQILRYFQMENFLLAGIGIVLGMLLAFAINQWLMGKYEMARLPLYYLPVGAALLWGLGQLAVYAPARRAASVPPAIATRSV
ncbi:ABC transporter permease [Pseudoxanthomonas broegbernensis]|uniref:ABC transporter permease n=1 Tax=Pseudoxanthomonas broegbernensis TaxID=83619 RepID=A0A7V8GMS8_9GAMM|nr:FtsX-like permease family protein [Pseudoxanthomonas broegbernensis]KAF1686662.1 ABC transporter permease [Pseudoxanthomonas broegbernensis]MBB6063579.1 putative ABC transport system permease protein [Pseudoxanthomonas broegbernensis]